MSALVSEDVVGAMTVGVECVEDDFGSSHVAMLGRRDEKKPRLTMWLIASHSTMYDKQGNSVYIDTQELCFDQFCLQDHCL